MTNINSVVIRCGPAGGTLALVLRSTALPEIYVLALLLGVIVATVLLVRRSLSHRTLHWIFIALSAVYLVFLLALGLIHLPLLRAICSENHVIEWTTTVLLLVAGALALTMAVRLGRAGEPSPVAACMAAAFFVASLREIEYGEPFFGGKVWFSRCLTRPKAYFDPDYFQRFAKHMGPHEQILSPYQTHLFFACGLWLLLGALIFYLVRHRKRIAVELRQLHRTAQGRFLLLGALGYGAAQGLGTLTKKLLGAGFLAEAQANCGGLHCIVEESVEMWAAACFLMAGVTFWRHRFRQLPHVPAAKH